jgi:hypothetical protein
LNSACIVETISIHSLEIIFFAWKWVLTDQQRMLTTSWQKILPSILSVVRVALHPTLHIFEDYDIV